MSTISHVTIPGHDGQALAAAPLGRRLGAALVDGLLSLAVIYLPYLLLLVWTVDLEGLVIAVLLTWGLSLAWGIFVWWMHAQRGYTPGKRAFGLRTQSVETGAPAGWLWILVRGGVPGLLGALTLGAGALLFALSILWDPQRRGWHDKIARTVVVEDRLVPVSTKTSAPTTTTSAAVSTPAQTTPSTAPAQRQAPSPVHLEPVPTPVAPTPLTARPDPVPPRPVGPEIAAVPDREPRPSAAPATGLISAVPGFATASVPAPGPAPAPLEEEDAAEHTVMRQPRRHPVVLRFDHGERLEVSGRGVVGRDPAPGSEATSHLVRMPEDSFSVSKTHLEFLPDGTGLRIRDLHSTNGVSILDSDGDRAVTPGEWASVTGGSTVRFGNHTFEVGS